MSSIALAQVFIIDEISMISAEMFEALEDAARKVMQRAEPFGGIQLVLSGGESFQDESTLRTPQHDSGCCKTTSKLAQHLKARGLMSPLTPNLCIIRLLPAAAHRAQVDPRNGR